MATLDRVLQLKQQGFDDSQIVQQLQNEGIPPFEIKDSMSQAQIKQAVAQNPPSEIPQPYGMQSSITDQGEYPPLSNSQQQFQETMQAPQAPQGEYQEEQYYNPSETPQTPSPYYEEQYSQQGYSQETTTELAEQIAEQIVLEKFNEFQEKTGDLVLFKQDVKDKLRELDSRLSRIEDGIENLQNAIIQKIGEFGENTASIQKDISMLHSTTSKLMNPLMDNYDALKKILREREEKF